MVHGSEIIGQKFNSDHLLNFVDKCKAGEIVLLVDEYDAPLTELMNDESEFEKVRERLSNFSKW